MKKLIPTIAMLSICFLDYNNCLAYTGDITGQVIEKETNTPVAYAEITFDNGSQHMVVTANEYGYYSVKRMETGKYRMMVKYNNHLFVMNKVRVMDSFTSAVNFMVSSSANLAATVEVEIPAAAKAKAHSTKAAPANAPATDPETAHKNSPVDQTIMDVVNPVKIYIKGQRA